MKNVRTNQNHLRNYPRGYRQTIMRPIRWPLHRDASIITHPYASAGRVYIGRSEGNALLRLLKYANYCTYNIYTDVHSARTHTHTHSR